MFMVNSWVNLSLYWNVYVAPWKVFKFQWAQKAPSSYYLSFFSSNCSMLFPCLANFSNSPLEIENLHHGWEDAHNTLFPLSLLWHLISFDDKECWIVANYIAWALCHSAWGQWWWKKWVGNIIKQLHNG